jgi:peroxiredoxin Q/BCP
MKTGDTASNFTLKDEEEKEFELYGNLEKNILLVFYPEDNSPVCSRQLADYNKSLDKFSENDIQIVGINRGSSESHSKFCSNLKLGFPLLADTDKKVSRLYDSINIFGINKRVLVLVGKSKKILWTDSRLPLNYLKADEIINRVRGL